MYFGSFSLNMVLSGGLAHSEGLVLSELLARSHDLMLS